jgi:hypothetical protein
MSNAIAVITKSGFGKSTSYGKIPELGIEGLNPSETLLINVKGKPLPFRGWRSLYQNVSGPETIPPTGNYVATTNHANIIKLMGIFNEHRPDIKNIIIDDGQYLMAEEFMANALKSGFDKFNKMAKNMYDVINAGINLRQDLNFILLTHEEEVKDGSFKMKTIGKMLDEKVTLEGLFTVILYGKESYEPTSKKVTKEFVTNFDGTYPAKSPVGMFESVYIPNDLGLVVKTINSYYNGE